VKKNRHTDDKLKEWTDKGQTELDYQEWGLSKHIFKKELVIVYFLEW